MLKNIEQRSLARQRSRFGLASLIANDTIEKCPTSTAGTSPDVIKMSTGFTLTDVKQWSLAQQRSCSGLPGSVITNIAGRYLGFLSRRFFLSTQAPLENIMT